ncbi:MAG: ABC transporter related [Anaerolineales bacterium]|nr:ABC transporter related [Anaerolineales bacterium]
MSEAKPGLRARLRETPAKARDAAHNIRRAFGLVWEAHHTGTLLMALWTIIGGLLPLAQAYIAKLIVDGVVNSLRAEASPMEGLRVVAPFLLAEFVLVVLQAGVAQARSLTEHILHSRLNLTINTRIIRKSLDLDLAYFENAEYYDKLQNARREADWRGLQIMNGGFYLIQNLLTLASFAVVLFGFNAWLALLLFVATVPAFIAQSNYADLNFRVISWRAPEARKLNYLEYLLTDYDAVKEVKLFALGEPLLGRYATLFWTFLREDQSIAQRRSLASLGWGLLATLTYYGAYFWIVLQTLEADITLGDMTLYLMIFRNSQNTFESIFWGLSEMYENGLFMSNLFAFLELEPRIRATPTPMPPPSSDQRGVEFRGVSFRYEGHDDWALRDVNLTIGPGEKIALVGPNGAGKTTLIKLLARLYDPTEGQILFNGVDLRDLDPGELRRRIGVIFQDFVHYHLAASENIGFGQIEALGDRPRIEASAVKSGAHPVITALPEGYETILGRWFAKGRDLSGGEWQKIALGRAFMRSCDILVLDEPTAALDAENEYQVFQQFRQLTEEKMAILISHRFSTVRMADRIYVLDDGQLREQGTHEELLARDGIYARLFTLQAQSYR